MRNVLIVGAGRMGVRHTLGCLNVEEISQVILTDINPEALSIAKKEIEKSTARKDMVVFKMNSDLGDSANNAEYAILAASLSDRKEQLQLALQFKPKHVLFEKPLAQSYRKVQDLVAFTRDSKIGGYLNLSFRLYDSFIKVRESIQHRPQYKGHLNITLNTGANGIGCNGIHYLDLIYFILDADRAEFIEGQIDDMEVASGRGPQFKDFGGWCVLKFYKGSEYKARALLSFDAESSVAGVWNIVGPNGRLYFSLPQSEVVEYLRKEDSDLPSYRFGSDYLPGERHELIKPFLGDITEQWLREMIQNARSLLPGIEQSLELHRLMFQWLERSAKYNEEFPIT